MYYHLLTWTKMMPYLKLPTITLQMRTTHRRHLLPWYTPTHTHTPLTHHLCKENTQIRTNIHVSLLPCRCIGCLSDSLHDVTTTYCHMQSCETVVTVWTGVKLDLMSHLRVRNESEVMCSSWDKYIMLILSQTHDVTAPPPQFTSVCSSFT